MKGLSIQIWGINESTLLIEKMCSDVTDTAKFHNISINFLGLGHKFIEHKQRLNILKKFLPTLNPETIVVCMDGSDTLFNDKEEILLKKFKEKKTQILISAEKVFTYQYANYKDKYDSINSVYKYINAGTFMGYAGSLIKMINEMIEINKTIIANDQGLLGIWVYNNINNSSLMKMDINSDIFWVTTDDWNNLSGQNNFIINPTTNTRPVIIHCCGKQCETIKKHYYNAYNTILKIK